MFATIRESSQQVLVDTPNSKLAHPTTSATRQKEKRQLVNEVKKSIEEEMNGQAIVLQNRISWRKYDKMRATAGLTNTRKRVREQDENDIPLRKKKHGRYANEWNEDHKVNWSALATRYGLSTSNRGQIIKEFLAENGIPAALVSQRTTRAPRRSKKKLRGGRTSVPMPLPASKEKEKLKQRIDQGEFMLGQEVVEREYTQFSVTPESELVTKNRTVTARKIPLRDIREKCLRKHETLGLLRVKENFTNLTREEVEVKLSQIGEKFEDKESDEDLCKKLIIQCSQRYFKLWHDHSSVDGHSYLLVLITPIYDPVFYLTPEMEQKTGVYMDVQGIVEQPEVHIVGRSSSSTAEQMMFNECRQGMPEGDW